MGGMDCLDLARERGRWQLLIKEVVKFQVT